MGNTERFHTGLVDQRDKRRARRLLRETFGKELKFQTSGEELIAVIPGAVWAHRMLSGELDSVLQQIRAWQLEAELARELSEELRYEIDRAILANMRQYLLNESKT